MTALSGDFHSSIGVGGIHACCTELMVCSGALSDVRVITMSLWPDADAGSMCEGSSLPLRVNDLISVPVPLTVTFRSAFR